MLHTPSYNRKKGFTLIEMLVAVFIFTVSLSVLMTISAKGLRGANNAQQQVRADYLALEAIEVVRNVRDSAFISGYGENNWQGVFQGSDIFSATGCFSDAGDCNFYFSNTAMILQTCVDCSVYFNESTNSYFQPEDGESVGTAVDTGFDRTIRFETTGLTPTEILITVVVTWTSGEVTYTENLHLWL